MAYTPQARLIENEQWFGRRKEPTPAQLAVIEHYREKSRKVFGAHPAGTHDIDTLGLFVSLLRPGGIPDTTAARH